MCFLCKFMIVYLRFSIWLIPGLLLDQSLINPSTQSLSCVVRFSCVSWSTVSFVHIGTCKLRRLRKMVIEELQVHVLVNFLVSWWHKLPEASSREITPDCQWIWVKPSCSVFYEWIDRETGLLKCSFLSSPRELRGCLGMAWGMAWLLTVYCFWTHKTNQSTQAAAWHQALAYTMKSNFLQLPSIYSSEASLPLGMFPKREKYFCCHHINKIGQVIEVNNWMWGGNNVLL